MISLTALAVTAVHLLIFGSNPSCGENECNLQLLDQLLKTKYEKRATPTDHWGNATTVNCKLVIRSFGSLSPIDMDYEVDLYLQQQWLDERLKCPNINNSLDINDKTFIDAIWKPDVYFPNAKLAEFQVVTVPNSLIRVQANGYITYVLRLKLTFSCMMDLSRFPLDNQVCKMELSSFSMTKDELQLKWENINPIVMYNGLKMPQFEILHIEQTDSCEEVDQLGSCLIAKFHLSRRVGFHLVNSYLPTMLIVIISWVSFWMDVDSVPGRTTLGVTTLLAIKSQSSGIQIGLPQVSYVKAIDVWMGICTAFVFCALLEFTIVNYLWRKSRPDILRNIFTEPVNEGTAGSKSYEENLHLSPVIPINVVKKKLQQKCTHLSCDENTTLLARKIDEYSRLMFPIAFIAFNALYWPYYLRD